MVGYFRFKVVHRKVSDRKNFDMIAVLNAKVAYGDV